MDHKGSMISNKCFTCDVEKNKIACDTMNTG